MFKITASGLRKELPVVLGDSRVGTFHVTWLGGGRVLLQKTPKSEHVFPRHANPAADKFV